MVERLNNWFKVMVSRKTTFPKASWMSKANGAPPTVCPITSKGDIKFKKFVIKTEIGELVFKSSHTHDSRPLRLPILSPESNSHTVTAASLVTGSLSRRQSDTNRRTAETRPVTTLLRQCDTNNAPDAWLADQASTALALHRQKRSHEAEIKGWASRARMQEDRARSTMHPLRWRVTSLGRALGVAHCSHGNLSHCPLQGHRLSPLRTPFHGCAVNAGPDGPRPPAVPT